jgi:hypothetical protein
MPCIGTARPSHSRNVPARTLGSACATLDWVYSSAELFPERFAATLNRSLPTSVPADCKELSHVLFFLPRCESRCHAVSRSR